VQNIREFASENAERAAQEEAVEVAKATSALSLRHADGYWPDHFSRVLEHACRSDELQRHGACGVRRGARSVAALAAHLA
jgi:hypothetical protein